MKKRILVLLLISGIASAAFSQDWFVGAGANFSFNKESRIDDTFNDNKLEIEYDIRIIGISPEIGYRSNNIDFGIKPIFQYTYQETNEHWENSNFLISNRNSLGFGIGFFTRYKFITFFNRLSVFGRLDTDYIFSKIHYELERQNLSKRKTETIQHGIGLGISPVIDFRLTDRFSLYSSIIGSVFSIKYLYSSENNITGDEYSRNRHSFDLTLPSFYNLSITDYKIGFYLIF